MAKNHRQSDFEFDYKLTTDSYISPNNVRAGYNETSPYSKVFLTAFSNRFRELEPEEDEATVEKDVVEEVVEEATEEAVEGIEEVEEEEVKEVAKTAFKKNKSLIGISIASAFVGLALMVLMFFNVMAPQLSSVNHIGNQVVDATGSGSLFYVQGALVIAAALLVIAIIVGFVQLGGKKRHFMGVASFLAFAVLITLGILCILEVKVGNIRFYEGFINFRNPLAPYEFKFILDIPCGYFIVTFFALLSFVLSCGSYLKLGKVQNIEAADEEMEEAPQATEAVAEEVAEEENK